MDWAEEELRTINMGDKRIDRRAKQLLSRLASGLKGPGSNISTIY